MSLTLRRPLDSNTVDVRSMSEKKNQREVMQFTHCAMINRFECCSQLNSEREDEIRGEAINAYLVSYAD